MSAPKEAYKLKSVWVKKDAILEENQIAAPVDPATAKSLFYLDKLLGQTLPDGSQGFIGMCNEGSFNMAHHNIVRRGSLRDSETLVYIGFKDAGLNTMGHTDSPVCTNKQSGAHVFQAFFKSSFYDLTTQHRILVRRTIDGTLVKQIVFGTMTYNEAATKSYAGPSVDFDYSAGDVVEIWSDITNPEGTYTSGLVSFVVEPRQYSARFNVSYASYACGNTNGTTTLTIYVTNWRINNGVALFQDVEMTTHVNPGFYSINGRWYEVEADFMTGSTVVDQDACGTWRQSDPAWIPPYQTINYAHYETTLSGSGAGCFVFDNSGALNPRTVYRNVNNNKYYATSAGAIAEANSNYAANGFYYEAGGVVTWVEIMNGVLVDSGSC